MIIQSSILGKRRIDAVWSTWNLLNLADKCFTWNKTAMALHP